MFLILSLSRVGCRAEDEWVDRGVLWVDRVTGPRRRDTASLYNTL